jgi:PIN domain nuclease of toxin-antitoxin system
LEKWPEAKELLGEFEEALVLERFHLLPITVPHVRAAGLIQAPHRDPFDRLIAAQATLEGLTLVSSDSRIATLGAPVLW